MRIRKKDLRFMIQLRGGKKGIRQKIVRHMERQNIMGDVRRKGFPIKPGEDTEERVQQLRVWINLRDEQGWISAVTLGHTPHHV